MSLFEVEPGPGLIAGQIVNVQLMWGVQRCMMIGLEHEAGWPVFRVAPPAPENPEFYMTDATFTVNVARCSAVEPGF